MINNLEEIPTIEISYQNIISLIESDEDIKKIAEEIEKDLVISMNLLHVANSALYGVKTGSVRQAITYLGLQNTKSLIISTSVINAINTRRDRVQHFEMLWKHSLLTNKVLSFLYEKFLHKRLPETALSAGLLHNIGVLIMERPFGEEYIAYKNDPLNKNVNILDMECQNYKVTHQEVGGYLLSWWELPFPIVEAALFHHRPFDSNIVNKELVMCIHIAQKCAWDISNIALVTPFYPEVYEKVGINQQEFEAKIKQENWD
jgi:HD-like signal output (HDOD) protein